MHRSREMEDHPQDRHLLEPVWRFFVYSVYWCTVILRPQAYVYIITDIESCLRVVSSLSHLYSLRLLASLLPRSVKTGIPLRKVP